MHTYCNDTNTREKKQQRITEIFIRVDVQKNITDFRFWGGNISNAGLTFVLNYFRVILPNFRRTSKFSIFLWSVYLLPPPPSVKRCFVSNIETYQWYGQQGYSCIGVHIVLRDNVLWCIIRTVWDIRRFSKTIRDLLGPCTIKKRVRHSGRKLLTDHGDGIWYEGALATTLSQKITSKSTF